MLYYGLFVALMLRDFSLFIASVSELIRHESVTLVQFTLQEFPMVHVKCFAATNKSAATQNTFLTSPDV